jgi:glycosyltransferase involved in cell wall biosynthesis
MNVRISTLNRVGRVQNLDLVVSMKKRIKILMLTASLSLTGTHRIMMNLLEGLDQERFEVLVAYKPLFPGPGDDLAPKIRELDFRLFRLRGRHLFDVKGLWDIYKIVRKYNIDIIHCWDSLTIMARLIGKICKIKIIDSIGNPAVEISRKEYLAKKVSSIFLDGAIFQSKESIGFHRKQGPNSLRWCRQEVIYNSINVRKIPNHKTETKNLLRKKYGLKENDIVITNLGMYNVQKSQEYLIQAVDKIVKHHNNIKLFLIGWGEREDFLRSQIQSLGLINHIVLTGKKQRDEVFEFLSITDIYVSSSLWEGLPIAALEAMAFGVPIVATDVVGNRETVADNVTGIFVPVRNSTAMARTIRHLIENPEVRERMGQAGRKRVEEAFTPDQFLEQHQRFYCRILSKA